MVRATAFLLTLLLAGCAGLGGAPTITRTVGGQTRRGIFVSPYSYEHFVRGELAFIAGDLREARSEYEMARAGPEDDPLLIARLAEVLDRLDDERAALALLQEGIALDPRSELVWLALGRVHERHGRGEDAIESYSRAASSAPSSEEAPLALAAFLRSQNRSVQADAVLERYLSRARGAGAARARLALAIERDRPDDAVSAVRALLEVAPARSDEVRAAARTALESERPHLAVQLLQALPERPEDRQLRLRAAIEAGDRDRAEGILASWMPRGPEELVAVARGYLAIDMADRAAEVARVALAAEDAADARLVLGEALARQGQAGDALAELARIDPGSAAWPEAPIAIGRALREAGRPALAAQVLSAAMARRGSTPIALALAEARMEAGNDEGALAALGGDEPPVRAARARVLDRLGRVEDAASAYASLGDAQVPERERVRARVEIAWRDGDRDAALTALGAWTERAPEDLLARARYAELLAAADRASQAREVAGETLALATDAPLRRRLSALVTSGAAPRAASP